MLVDNFKINPFADRGKHISYQNDVHKHMFLNLMDALFCFVNMICFKMMKKNILKNKKTGPSPGHGKRHFS